MNWQPCDREEEVMEAAASGRLESRWGEELRAHLAACPGCADLALVADSLRQDNEAAAEARLPSAALVWWKAQLRARREAAQQALRPVRIAENVVLASTLLLAVLGLAGLALDAPASQLWEAWPAMRDLLTLQSSLVMASAAAVVCLLGFALYAVLSD